MNYKKIVIISWLLVILWAGLIFFMSSMDTNKSNDTSKNAINNIVEKTIETTNGLGITDKHPSENKMKQVIENWNKPLRKIAHASEYFILTILLIMALNNSEVTGKKVFLLAVLICFIYACTDEYHQSFVNGRTAQLSDISIDTIGAILGCISNNLFSKFIKKKKKYG